MHVLAPSGEGAASLGLHPHQAQREGGLLVAPLPIPRPPSPPQPPACTWPSVAALSPLRGKGRLCNFAASFFVAFVGEYFRV